MKNVSDFINKLRGLQEPVLREILGELYRQGLIKTKDVENAYRIVRKPTPELKEWARKRYEEQYE